MIAVDICNTLANVGGELEKLGIKQDIYPAPMPERFFSSPEGLKVFQNAQPINGANFVVNHYSTLFGGVTYVTTRPIEAGLITHHWLANNGFPNGKIHFCKWEEKPGIYAKLKPHVIIEDDPRVLDRIKHFETLIMVPQWAYNNHIIGNRILPLYEWGKSEEASGWR